MVLEELRSLLHGLSAKVNTLLRHHSMQVEDHAIPEGINFPLKEMTEIEALETKLRELDNEKKVVSYMNSFFFYC